MEEIPWQFSHIAVFVRPSDLVFDPTVKPYWFSRPVGPPERLLRAAIRIFSRMDFTKPIMVDAISTAEDLVSRSYSICGERLDPNMLLWPALANKITYIVRLSVRLVQARQRFN